ncbi:hypothetical protein [Streptomyces sp. NPDC056160]|uniref:hypothetical protein n=1 Tax=Streptomyces sp. NPDC056160 TaxID=3345731 RepID=UPI0035E05396
MARPHHNRRCAAPGPHRRRTALAYAAAALLLLLALTAVLALGAAYAPRPAHRTAARHTLHLLLRLAPWYPDGRRERARGECFARGSRH